MFASRETSVSKQNTPTSHHPIRRRHQRAANILLVKYHNCYATVRLQSLHEEQLLKSLNTANGISINWNKTTDKEKIMTLEVSLLDLSAHCWSERSLQSCDLHRHVLNPRLPASSSHFLIDIPQRQVNICHLDFHLRGWRNCGCPHLTLR